MNFSPPTNLLDICYDLLDKLIKKIQLHAGTQRYTMCRLRTKKLPFTGLLETCYLCYDWGQKKRVPIRQKRKHNGSCRNDCLFSLVAKITDNSWFIWEIYNSNHNHLPTIAASHLSLQKLHMIPAITLEIEWGTQINLQPGAIIDLLRLGQGENFNNNEPMYKTKDIYNIKAELQRKNLRVLSSIQSLIQKLNTLVW